MPDRIYRYTDFVQAHLDAVRHEQHHPDLTKYYGDLYQHLSEFFQVDLQTESDREFSIEGFGLGALFRAGVRYYNQVTTPFETFVVISPAMHPILQIYSPQYETLAHASRAQCFELLCELYRRLYGETDQVLTSAELRERGFDDSRKPDEKMYYV